jgi:hypothetical protein
VILESIEEDIPKLPDIQIGGSNIKRSPWLKTHLKMLLKAFIGKREWLAILLDRLSKQVMYHYIASTISRAEERWKDKVESLSAPLPKQIPAEDPVNSLFFNSKNISEEDINRIAERIKNYKQELIKRGIRFIFFPLPNREFVYREDISVQGGVFYFRLLIDKLRGEGMDVIDVLPVFKADYKKNHILLYHTDDTHWNPYGVRLAVDVAIKLLKEGRP